MKKLFAFWKYDQFPYLLGAPVSKINEKGMWHAPNYQMWFRPQKLLPIKQGEELKEKLEKLDKEYKKEHKLVDEKFNKLLEELIKTK